MVAVTVELTGVERDRMEAFCAALESDEYQQARGVLRRLGPIPNAGFCCLGVMCEVAILLGAQIETRPSTQDVLGKNHIQYRFLDVMSPQQVDEGNYGWEGGQLPIGLGRWFGVESGQDPTIIGPDGFSRGAVYYNDELRWNFKQIAAGFRYTYLGTPYPPEAATWPRRPVLREGRSGDVE